MDYQELIERLRSFEIDHSPDGWPAIRMREISAMCDAIEALLSENERLNHNLATTEQTMREYQELAAKRLEEIEWLNGVCDDLKNKNALLSAHTELFSEEAYRLDDLSTDYAHRLAYWIEKHDSLLAELAKYRDAPVVAYIRKWAFDGEEPKKEKRENGRLAWPFKFKLIPVSQSMLLKDDIPLIVKPGEEK